MDSEVLASGKSFRTFDVDFKLFLIKYLEFFGKIAASPGGHFPIQNSYSKIFLDIKLLLINRFSKYLLHILGQIKI